MKFSDLASFRHALQDFCGAHAASVKQFKSGTSFTKGIDESPDGKLHTTTTATCIESLLECPESPRGDGADSVETMARTFAKAALDRPEESWRSERSAGIYCRCRALPLAIRYSAGFGAQIGEHVERILGQVRDKQDRFGIGEADPKEKPPSNYPPNAFHTFWTLEVLEEFERRLKDRYQELDGRLGIGHLRAGMILWAKNSLAFQVSLHSAGSSDLDSDQLAWSLAVLLKFTDGYLTDLGEQDLVREALKRLFETQLKTGSWRHYRSLFHYRDAGNAYCYVYETFAVLLRIALMEKKRGGVLLREWLRPHLDELVKLWRYAD